MLVEIIEKVIGCGAKMTKAKDNSKRKKRISNKEKFSVTEPKVKRLRTLKPRWFIEKHLFDCGKIANITFQVITPSENNAKQMVWAVCGCEKCGGKVHTFIQGTIYSTQE
jgi:hypothetical protein